MAAIVQVTKAVRFAFVGCGTIARHHLGALKQSSHATAVTAVVDVNRERAESLLRLLPKTQEENSQKCKVWGDLQTQQVSQEIRSIHSELLRACTSCAQAMIASSIATDTM